MTGIHEAGDIANKLTNPLPSTVEIFFSDSIGRHQVKLRDLAQRTRILLLSRPALAFNRRFHVQELT